MAMLSDGVDAIGARPIPEFDGVHDVWPRGRRLAEVRAAAAAYKERFAARAAVPQRSAPGARRPGETIYSATKHACLAFSVGTLLDLRRAGIDGVHVSALCPDGTSAPMLYDELDDPE